MEKDVFSNFRILVYIEPIQTPQMMYASDLRKIRRPETISKDRRL